MNIFNVIEVKNLNSDKLHIHELKYISLLHKGT